MYSNYSSPEKRGDNPPPQKNKFQFAIFKKNTICSLNDIEHFLNQCTQAHRWVRLYKLLK